MKAVLSSIFSCLIILNPPTCLFFLYLLIGISASDANSFQRDLHLLVLFVTGLYLYCLMCYVIWKWIEKRHYSETELKALNAALWFVYIATTVYFARHQYELLASVVYAAELFLYGTLCHIAIHWSARLYRSWKRKDEDQGQGAKKILQVLCISLVMLFVGIRMVDYADYRALREKTVKWLGFLAEQGVADAQHSFARRYALGWGVQKSTEERARWYRLAAEQGHRGAQYDLGELYRTGRGVIPRDHAEAEKWFRLAAEQGHASAEFRIKAIEAQKLQLQQYRIAAEQGDADAQYHTGEQYYFGHGYHRNYEEAEKWFRLAGEQGSDDALYRLGVMYYEGRGVTKDYAEAEKWFRLAGEQGSDDALYRLGKMYYEGRGVTEDNAEAEKWFRLAAEQGYLPAQWMLERLQLPEELRLAADQEDVDNLYRTGKRRYSDEEDYEEAAQQFRSAAEQGHAEARTWIGIMHYKGEGIPQDYAEAAKWFKLAAGQGNADAQVWIGSMYYKGLGVAKDHSKAQEWFSLAAEQGHEDGRAWLERMRSP